jgi:predicted MFS family arabinose efflux permease
VVTFRRLLGFLRPYRRSVAASFVLAAAALATPLPHTAVEDEPFGKRLRDGLAYVRRRPVLRRIVAADFALAVIFAVILPVEVVLVTDTLGASDSALGVVLAAWGGGAVVGSLLLPRVGGSRAPLAIFAAVVTIAVAYLGMGAAPSVSIVVGFSALGGVANGVGASLVLTLIQARTAERFQARVNGLVEAVHTGAPGAGFVIGGAIATVVSARAAYLFAGAAALCVIAAATIALRAADWADDGGERETQPRRSAAAGAEPVLPALTSA